MNTGDKVRDQLDSADRMLRTARQEYAHGAVDNAVPFLRAAIRNLNLAANTLEDSNAVVSIHRSAQR